MKTKHTKHPAVQGTCFHRSLLKQAAALTAVTLALTACGSPNLPDTDTSQTNVNNPDPAGTSGTADASGNSGSSASGSLPEDYIFQPKFFSLEGEYIDYSGVQSFGEAFCYLSMEPDEETQHYVPCLNFYSPERGERTFAPLAWPREQDNIHLSSYAFGPESELYALAVSYSQDPPGSKDYLCRFDAQGNCLFARDITDSLREDPDHQPYISSLKLDSENRIYLQGNEAVWLFDGEGTPRGMLSPGTSENAGTVWINAMFPSGDGSMYISYTSPDSPVRNYTLAELDFEENRITAVSADFPGSNAFAPGSDNVLLMHDFSTLSAYDPVSGKEEVLLNWLDCNINGNEVLTFWQEDNGTIVAAVSDSESREAEIAVLTRTTPDQVRQKETIVLAVLRGGYNYQPAVVNFNKSNDKYQITIKEYMDSESGGAASRADALAKLYADLVSGNCPDIVELTGLDTPLLAGKGAFEDLTPLLEQSSLLKKEDFVEEILAAYTFDSKLISVPALFFLETILGDSTQVGPDSGWTIEDLIALGEAHPEAELFDSADRNDMLNIIMRYSGDTFIDRTAGECSFDSDAFRNLLEFINRFPEEPDRSPDQPTTPIRIQNGEVLLKDVWLYDFDSIQMDMEIFRGNAACIGFPSPDGSSRHSLTTAYAFAIPSNAAHKEGAWAFIENFLLKESTKDNNRNQTGFPSVKRRLEAMLEEAVTPEYLLDENGELWLDENGEPVLIGNTQTTSSSDGWTYTYHTATREEADLILSLLESAVLTGSGDDEILTIITQEAEAFFSGQKTPEAVSEIIQNRVSLYINENLP